ASIRAEDAIGERDRRAAVAGSLHLALDLLAVARMDDARVGANAVADELRRRIAADLFQRLGCELDRPVGVERAPVKGAGDARDERAQALVRLPELGVRPAELSFEPAALPATVELQATPAQRARDVD